MVDLDTTLHVCMAGLVVMVIDWSGGVTYLCQWLFEDLINTLCRESST
jgi:hypothetical protein